MKYDEFINQVRERTGLSREETERQTTSFFEMIGARIQQNEANDLASQLPTPLDEAVLRRGDEMQKVDAEGFFEQLGGGQTGEETHEYAKAIWDTLCETITPGEVDDLKSNLPEDIVEALEGDGSARA